jgi:hypothetical protein
MKNKNEVKKSAPIIIVYFDKDRKTSQVVKPTDDFNGDCQGYVNDVFTSRIREMDGTIVTRRHYYSYETIMPI